MHAPSLSSVVRRCHGADNDTWYKQLTSVHQAKIAAEVCAADHRLQDHIAAGQPKSSSKPSSVEKEEVEPMAMMETKEEEAMDITHLSETNNYWVTIDE